MARPSSAHSVVEVCGQRVAIGFADDENAAGVRLQWRGAIGAALAPRHVFVASSYRRPWTAGGTYEHLAALEPVLLRVVA
jgi:hypothetical protein